ncbi:MAG: STAS domain-containing protein [Deltaproteobacteria bacterium]|nr:STAS domain-containing protein [Candidatus Anaeroferrophillacea bacterium]
MHITTRLDGNIGVITLEGELTVHMTDRFRAAVAALLDTPATAIIVDAGALDYIDSSGLGALVSAHATLTRKNRRLALCNVSAKVDEIMRITKLDRYFVAGASVAEARTRLTGS